MRRVLALFGRGSAARVGRLGIPPASRVYAARLLADLIEAAREQAIADGVRPVPATVSRGLLGYFPRALLEKTRFGGGGSPILAPPLALRYGDAGAVVLGDVILFRHARAAQADLASWAHQLTHVMQYQRWGLHGLAMRYVEDADAVEQEASANAHRFSRWDEGLQGIATAIRPVRSGHAVQGLRDIRR